MKIGNKYTNKLSHKEYIGLLIRRNKIVEEVKVAKKKV